MKIFSYKIFLAIIIVGLLSTQGFCYDRVKTVNYANQWWNTDLGYNSPPYHDYTDEGGDCTNFVSQCLIAGGFRFTGQGYMGDGGTLIRVADMPGALQNSHSATISVNTIPSNLKVGDVVSLGDDTNTYKHTIIVVSPGNTIDTLLVASHTDAGLS